MEQLFWSALSAVLPGIVVGAILYYWQRKQRQQDAWNNQQQATKVDRDMLELDLLVAAAQLSYAVAMAQKRGTPNGEMETAIEQYEKSMEKFRQFERKQLALNYQD